MRNIKIFSGDVCICEITKKKTRGILFPRLVGVEIAKHGDKLLFRGKMDGLLRIIPGAFLIILYPALNPHIYIQLHKSYPFIKIIKNKEHA